MRIFYINRDVDSDRREMMKAALQETGIEAERVPGVTVTMRQIGSPRL